MWNFYRDLFSILVLACATVPYMFEDLDAAHDLVEYPDTDETLAEILDSMDQNMKITTTMMLCYAGIHFAHLCSTMLF